MDKARPTQFPDCRDSGKMVVLSAIRRLAPVARIDIAEATGLSRATVTSITAELLSRDLIKEVPGEVPLGAVKRGRPRVNLQINAKAHLVAGMKLTNKYATVVILDFVGDRVAEISSPTKSAVLSAEDTCTFLQETLQTSLQESGISINQISGIGVGIPGVIDAPEGMLRWSPAIVERDVPLQSMLSDAFGVPAFLENDANLVAMAEQQFGLGKNLTNFIIITIEQGVGMGIVIDGQLYRGTGGSGAEFGHTKVQLDGALCRCGQRGCLEAYVGDYALLREASIAMGAAAGATIEERMNLLMSEARSGNQMALSIFRRAGRMFAMGLANVINMFAPELIILAGERMQYDYLFDESVINDVQKSVVQKGGPPTDVKVHKWGDRMWAMGAATYAIEGVTNLALSGAGTDEK